MDNNDRKLIEISTKEMLMEIVKESEIINEKLSFYQKTLLYDKISEMSHADVVSLMFNDGNPVTTEQLQDYDSKIKKAAMYGAAGEVGRRVGKHFIGGKAIKAGTLTVAKATRSNPLKGRSLAFLGRTKGGIIGALGGVAGMFLFRKLSNPCVRKNIGNPEAQKQCKAAAIKKVISQIQADMQSNPKNRGKLQKDLNKWQERLRNTLAGGK